MRLGLISDIHADFDGLLAALTLFHNLGVDRILCAGDLVEKGKQGDTVVAVMRAREIACVRGNHDEMVVGNQAWLRENGDPSNPNYHARLLQDGTLSYLKDLPLHIRLEAEGRRILLTHGTPRSNNEYVYPNSPPDLFRLVAREAGAEAVILGHTHQPMCVEVGEVLIVNPGSVCDDGSGTCAVLDLPGGSFELVRIATGERLAGSDFRSYRID